MLAKTDNRGNATQTQEREAEDLGREIARM
jgi:hypothetical protein